MCFFWSPRKICCVWWIRVGVGFRDGLRRLLASAGPVRCTTFRRAVCSAKCWPTTLTSLVPSGVQQPVSKNRFKSLSKSKAKFGGVSCCCFRFLTSDFRSVRRKFAQRHCCEKESDRDETSRDVFIFHLKNILMRGWHDVKFNVSQLLNVFMFCERADRILHRKT